MTMLFNKALEQTNGRKILLLGNGFSCACAQANFREEKNAFDYEFLAKKAGNPGIEKLLEKPNTNDFEQVIHEIHSIHRKFLILNYFWPENNTFQVIIDRLKKEEKILKQGLITAIHSIHPLKPFNLLEESYKKCANFLRNFDAIYTVNYDLLLYWAQMQDVNNNSEIIFNEQLKEKFRDGFCDKMSNKKRYWKISCPETNLFYLHGALHLFCDNSSGKHIYKLIYKSNNDLINQIEKKIMRRDNYPLCVAEGNSDNKLKKIQSNDYLFNVYSSLKNERGAIFTFGISFNKDDHLLDAIANSWVTRVFIGIRNNNEETEIIREKVKRKLSSSGKEIEYYSTDFPIW